MEALLVLLGAAAAILSGWVTRRIEFGYERQRQRDDARMADSVALQDAVDELNRAYSLFLADLKWGEDGSRRDELRERHHAARSRAHVLSQRLVDDELRAEVSKFRDLASVVPNRGYEDEFRDAAYKQFEVVADRLGQALRAARSA
jgi:hypothetical protein